MDVNRANLDAMFTTYSTAFQSGLDNLPPQVLAFLQTEFPSNSAGNFYAWLDRFPGFREWVGDRVFHNVTSKKFEILNRTYEDSVVIGREDIEDDQFGIYTPIIGAFPRNWMELQNELVMDVLTANPTAFTNLPFIDTGHLYGANTINNKTTSALSATSFEAAFLTAADWKFADDKFVRPRFTHLIVGEKNRTNAFNIVKNTKVDSGSSSTIDNPNLNRVDVVVSEQLIGAFDDHWYLLQGNRAVNAVALQIRRVPTPIMDTRPEEVELTNEVKFMASGRIAAGPTFPHLIFGGIL